MRVLAAGLIVLLPSLALAADEKAKPASPLSLEAQAFIYLKQTADRREESVTLEAFKMRGEIDNLNSRITKLNQIVADRDAELAKLRDENKDDKQAPPH